MLPKQRALLVDETVFVLCLAANVDAGQICNLYGGLPDDPRLPCRNHDPKSRDR